MTPFIRWVVDLIELAPYEQIVNRRRFYMDKYNKIWDSFIRNAVG